MPLVQVRTSSSLKLVSPRFLSNNTVSPQMAYQSRQREAVLQMTGHSSTVDLERMIQVDELAGTVRQVQRRIAPQQTQKGPFYK